MTTHEMAAELAESRAVAQVVLGEDAEGMTAAEVIRDLQQDRELLQGELAEALPRLEDQRAGIQDWPGPFDDGAEGSDAVGSTLAG